jgi:hypothetical protein
MILPVPADKAHSLFGQLRLIIDPELLGTDRWN